MSNEPIATVQEAITTTLVVEREVLLDTQQFPIVVETPEREVLTLERESHVIEETPEVQVITVGEAGPPGPPGVGGGSTALTKLAGMILSGHRAVVLNSLGKAVYADHTNSTHQDKVLGITLNAANVDENITIQPYGEITEPSWNWTLDQRVFLSTNGQLTQTPPTTGFLQPLGFPNGDPTKLFVDIDTPIIL